VAVGTSSASLQELAERAAAGQSGAWDGLVDRLAPVVWESMRPRALHYEDRAEVWRTVWVRLGDLLAHTSPPDRIEVWASTVASREVLRLQRLSPAAEI
jgi:hypothetical protein